jgi:hypothetical protein
VRKWLQESPKGEEIRQSAPHNVLLIKEIIDDFDAVPHLGLRTLGHRDDCADDLTGLNVVE